MMLPRGNRPPLQPPQFEISPRKRPRPSMAAAVAAIHNIPNVKVVALDFGDADADSAPTSPEEAAAAAEAPPSAVVSEEVTVAAIHNIPNVKVANVKVALDFGASAGDAVHSKIFSAQYMPDRERSDGDDAAADSAPTSPKEAAAAAAEAPPSAVVSEEVARDGGAPAATATATPCKPAPAAAPKIAVPTPTPTPAPKIAGAVVETEGGWTTVTYLAIGIAVVSVAFVSRPELFRIAGRVVRGLL